MLKILQIKHFTKKGFVIVIQSSAVIHVHKNKRFTWTKANHPLISYKSDVCDMFLVVL